MRPLLPRSTRPWPSGVAPDKASGPAARKRRSGSGWCAIWRRCAASPRVCSSLARRSQPKCPRPGWFAIRMNDYSVPTRFAFQDVMVKGFVDEVVIVAGAEIIARHERIYGRNQFVLDPKHYLALLERKPGALDQAAPLQSWTLPEEFQRIRRLLESRMGNRGKKEFIQILRLLEVFEEAIVAAGVVQAMQLGAISFDAVKQLVLARIERRPARLDLARYPYLPTAEVRTTVAADYAALLSRSAA